MYMYFDKLINTAAMISFLIFFKTWHNCISPNSNFYSPGFGDLSLGDIMERIIAWWLHKHEMCCQAAVWRLHLASEMIDAVSVCDLGNNFFFFFPNTTDMLNLSTAGAIKSLLMKTFHLFLLLSNASFECSIATRSNGSESRHVISIWN